MADRAIHAVFSGLSERLPLHAIGRFPTPIDPVPELEDALGAGAGTLFVKRDDLTAPGFGGNKVRTLEVFFAAARSAGADRVYATGAYGSNHALATAVHAEAAGLAPCAALYPQPPSTLALANAKAIARRVRRFVALPHWSMLPLGVAWIRREERRRGHAAFVMPPGGATALGALGYVNGALELALQLAAGVAPLPSRIVVAGGSGCTTAGLLVGLALAERLGIGAVAGRRSSRPIVVSVRVTPWPVTSKVRLCRMAARTSALLAALAGEAALRFAPRDFHEALAVDGRFLGRGYGFATPEALAASELFRRAGRAEVEPTYTGKAAASLVDSIRRGARGPTLFWATQSSTRPPDEGLDQPLQGALARWVRNADQAIRRR
jgi:D-cysteine desulfhydrase